jgi:hypothetical protein
LYILRHHLTISAKALLLLTIELVLNIIRTCCSPPDEGLGLAQFQNKMLREQFETNLASAPETSLICFLTGGNIGESCLHTSFFLLLCSLLHLQNFITKGFDVKESDTNRNLRYWIKRESV